jgi:hypothetical protein
LKGDVGQSKLVSHGHGLQDVPPEISGGLPPISLFIKLFSKSAIVLLFNFNFLTNFFRFMVSPFFICVYIHVFIYAQGKNKSRPKKHKKYEEKSG